jgi:hypothetical protein
VNKFWVVFLFFAVIAVWCLCFWLLNDAHWGGVPLIQGDSFIQFGDRGTFGDMFGAVNALFSGLAFAGLICTLVVQMQELKAQREELKETRGELKGQKDIMQKQSEQIDRQNFESGFFQLLKLHFECLNSISVRVSSKDARSGAYGLESWYIFVFNYVNSDIKGTSGVDSDKLDEIIDSRVNEFLYTQNYPFSSYFLSLISLFKFIDNGTIKDKDRYRALVIGRMTIHELRGLLVTVGMQENPNVLGFILYKEMFEALESNEIVDALKNRLERD